MRIVHAVDGYPPVPGGMEHAVETLAVAQSRAGHDVTVLSLGHPDLPTSGVRDGVRLERVESRLGRLLRRASSDSNHLFHPTVPDPGVVSRLREVVAETGADVLHAHGWLVASAVATPLPSRTVLVHTLHDYGLVCATKTFMPDQRLDVLCEGPSLRRCLPCAAGFYGWPKGALLVGGLRSQAARQARIDLFLPTSEAVARAVLPDVGPDRCVVVPGAVADERLDAAARAQPRPTWVPSGDYLLFVGQLGEHKGIGLLAQAQTMMRADVPLVVVGAARADTPHLPGTASRPVVLAGQRSPDEVLVAQQAAAVCVVPSRWAEPFGLVAVEALATGTPVVASAIGGLCDIVTPETGVLVAPGDAAALAVALDTLLEDPVRRAALARAGAARAREFAASAVARRVVAAYQVARDAKVAASAGGTGTGESF